MRKLSFPTPSDQGVDEFAAPPSITLNEAEFVNPFDEPASEAFFYAESPRVRGGGASASPKKAPSGKRKRPSLRRVQLLLLLALIGVIAAARKEILIAGHFALLASSSLNKNCLWCRYKIPPAAIH